MSHLVRSCRIRSSDYLNWAFVAASNVHQSRTLQCLRKRTETRHFLSLSPRTLSATSNARVPAMRSFADFCSAWAVASLGEPRIWHPGTSRLIRPSQLSRISIISANVASLVIFLHGPSRRTRPAAGLARSGSCRRVGACLIRLDWPIAPPTRSAR